MNDGKRSAGSIVFLLILLTVLVSGCSDKSIIPGSQGKPNMAFATEYQAVFLDNGQTFFGKLENTGSSYPLLTDVFYIQSQVNEATKEVKHILIRRGNEWHGPDRMYLNTSHIILIEPVSASSQVAKLIQEAKTQKPAAAQ